MVKKREGRRRMSSEGKFALAGVAALALVVTLACWFAVPFSSPWSEVEALLAAQTEAEDQEPEQQNPENQDQDQDLEQAARVDVNHAGLEELCTLPGVGEAKAQAILDYRAKYGAFKELWEVRRVNGITQKLVDSWGAQAYLG
jgi:competence protein ComEA